MKSAGATRTYRMVGRAAAAAETRERIVDAAVELFWEQPTERIRLDEVAVRAGVTVQTVIRRFGGKEALFAAAAEREVARVRAERADVAAGDVAAAVANLVRHYEKEGDRVLRLLAAQGASPAMEDVVVAGRRVHREWCQQVFAPFLIGLDRATARRRIAQLVAVCDVYTWKLLRRDSGLSRAQTETAIAELLAPFTKESG